MQPFPTSYALFLTAAWESRKNLVLLILHHINKTGRSDQRQKKQKKQKKRKKKKQDIFRKKRKPEIQL